VKLATFAEAEGPLTGVIEGDTIRPLRDTVEMRELIERGGGWTPAGPALPLRSVRLLAPIVPRRNVFCVGWNYTEHFVEGKDFRGPAAPQEIPAHPALFTKNPFAIVGPDAAVRHPAPLSEELDYEVELAVVIGRAGRDISEADALEHVFGYTIGNDVSVRDVQRTWHGGQWFKGKNFDTHLPLGPWIVTADEIPDPQALRLTTRVNGVTKQDSNTRHMVFPVRRIIAELSAGLTLHPGDVILTGTPEGVAMGRKPPEWLRPGDVMELEIEGIGVLRNPVERSA
jgi:2-keto-4-pentenoate hydratase/2-oxohepta-3-ene-1,7-dioic acid hydratase in catechol pathway